MTTTGVMREGGGPRRRPSRLFVLWLLSYPSFCALLSLLLSGYLAALEGVAFWDAFLWLLTFTSKSLVPLTPWTGPTGSVGWYLTNLLGIMAVFVQAAHIGLAAGPVMEPLLEIRVPRCLRCWGLVWILQ